MRLFSMILKIKLNKQISKGLKVIWRIGALLERKIA